MKKPFLLWVEWILIFIGVPLLVYSEVISLPNAIFLFAITALVIWILRKDDSYHLPPLFENLFTQKRIKWLAIKTMVVALGILAITYWFNRSSLFSFPLQRPWLWLLVMVIYPVFSVLPQEIIYRVFFFHRYKKLFSRPAIMVFASTLAFSFLHIVYDNGWAVGFTLVGGFLFSRTYSQSKSLLWVSIEHTLYGWLIFTIGMGSYFFESSF